MNSDEALAVVEAVLSNNRLNKLQKTVFCQTWEEQSYQAIAHRFGYEVGYVKQTGSQLWQLLSQALNEKVTKHNVQHILHRKAAPSEVTEVINASTPPPPIPRPACFILPKTDWGEAVDAPVFFGRVAELATLTHWIEQDGCRLVGLFGMGGIGKTSLSVRLAKQCVNPASFDEAQFPFEWVVWRSLRNAPPLTDLLADLIQTLSNQSGMIIPDTLDGRIRCLLTYLQRHRCLVVLDNGETVMQQGDHGGKYLPGYEGYGQFWRWVGEAEHASTIVLTSREKPREIAAIEGKTLPVRSLRLHGLSATAGQELFHIKGSFTGSETNWQTLVEHYAGNPLALKMVATVIQDLFDGEIANFLECLREGTSVFGDIRDLLTQQFDRLSPLEQHVLYWLAIARKPITLSQLRANFSPPIPLGDLLEALSSLERRYLIDKAAPLLLEKSQTRFTLQPAVMEYVTERLIAQVNTTISQQDTPSLFHTHSLIQAQARDYIRETQVRMILQPIADRLLAHYAPLALEELFRQQLEQLRHVGQRHSYGAGNIINLLCCLGTDLTGWDFSGLSVRNAYLRGVNLRQVNFQGSDLSKSAFTETFSQVLAVAFNPDGTVLATGDVNHDIHLWQVADSKLLMSFRVEEGWVWSVAFSPNGRWLASANRTVHLWDIQTGACIRTFDGYSDRVFTVAFSPDGQLLATGSEDHLVRVWNVRTGELLHTLQGHTDEVRSIAFSPTGRRARTAMADWLLASGSYDGTVRLWNATQGTCLTVLEAHTDWIWSIAISPDGQTLASGSQDATVTLWQIETGKCIQTLSHPHPVRTVSFSPNGRTLASGSGIGSIANADNHTIRLWNYLTGDCLKVLFGHTSWISTVAFSPDQGILASGSEDQSVRLWDSQTSHCLKTLQGYSNGVWSVAFDSTDTCLASGSQDRQVRLWDRKTGALRHRFSGHTNWVWSVVFSPNQAIVASSSEDRTIRLWHTQTYTCLRTLEGHRDAVLSILFSPDGHTLISSSLDGTIKWWEVATGRQMQTAIGHRGGIWGIALSGDGALLASASQDQTIRLWDGITGQCRRTLVGHQSWVRCVAISPDQETLISGSADGIIKIWRLGDGICEHTLCAHRGAVLSIAFHPSGNTFASSGTDAQIKHWSTTTYQSDPTHAAHDRWVRFLAYSPDGETLASCSQDETIKLWNPSHPPATLRIPRPYEGMAIAHATGITDAQRATLKMLGAIERV